jgi:hypothetical protein
MNMSEVEGLMGPPDDKRSLHEPVVMKGRRIGTTWFYLQDPNAEIGGGTGTGHETSSKEIRVYFDLQDRVKDAWDNMGGVSLKYMAATSTSSPD